MEMCLIFFSSFAFFISFCLQTGNNNVITIAGRYLKQHLKFKLNIFLGLKFLRVETINVKKVTEISIECHFSSPLPTKIVVFEEKYANITTLFISLALNRE